VGRGNRPLEPAWEGWLWAHPGVPHGQMKGQLRRNLGGGGGGGGRAYACGLGAFADPFLSPLVPLKPLKKETLTPFFPPPTPPCGPCATASACACDIPSPTPLPLRLKGHPWPPPGCPSKGIPYSWYICIAASRFSFRLRAQQHTSWQIISRAKRMAPRLGSPGPGWHGAVLPAREVLRAPPAADKDESSTVALTI